jgi:hypothetical protein
MGYPKIVKNWNIFMILRGETDRKASFCNLYVAKRANRPSLDDGATCRIRTDDPLFTKQML